MRGWGSRYTIIDLSSMIEPTVLGDYTVTQVSPQDFGKTRK